MNQHTYSSGPVFTSFVNFCIVTFMNHSLHYHFCQPFFALSLLSTISCIITFVNQFLHYFLSTIPCRAALSLSSTHKCSLNFEFPCPLYNVGCCFLTFWRWFSCPPNIYALLSTGWRPDSRDGDEHQRAVGRGTEWQEGTLSIHTRQVYWRKRPWSWWRFINVICATRQSCLGRLPMRQYCCLKTGQILRSWTLRPTMLCDTSIQNTIDKSSGASCDSDGRYLMW